MYVRLQASAYLLKIAMYGIRIGDKFETHVFTCMIDGDPRYCRLCLRHFWYQSLALLKLRNVCFLNEDRRFC